MNVQIGNFNKVFHGAEDWNNNLRGVISFSLQKNLLMHFMLFGNQYYSQYVTANYPSGEFTAK